MEVATFLTKELKNPGTTVNVVLLISSFASRICAASLTDLPAISFFSSSSESCGIAYELIFASIDTTASDSSLSRSV